MDIAPDVAASLAAMTPSRTRLEDPSKLPLALLLRHLPVVDELSTVNGGVFALVGPTGAGKTTTIAKLASRWSMQHGSDDLALVSTDCYRIGAREQLMTYARILGATMHAPNSGRGAGPRARPAEIETPGLDRHRRHGTARCPPRASSSRRCNSGRPGKGAADAARAGRGACARGDPRAPSPRFRPAACILTKVDEAASLGAVISTVLRHRLPIAYLCNGQRVPEDLHAAHSPTRLAGARRACGSRSAAPLTRDEAYLRPKFRPRTSPCMICRLSRTKAEELARLNSTRPVKVLAVTGGKGGVGKTTVSTNLAVSIAAQGPRRHARRRRPRVGQRRRAAGTAHAVSLGHVINGECALEDAIVTGPARAADRAGGLRRSSAWRTSRGRACGHHPRVQRPLSSGRRAGVDTAAGLQ